MESKQSNNKILALFIIVDYSNGQTVGELFKKYKLPLNLFTHGFGAANSEIYDILGFGESKKAITLSITTEPMAQYILKILRSEMSLNKPGTGIAFTIQVSSISSVLSMLCNSTDVKEYSESEEMHMIQNMPYDLILTIVNNGYFDEVMEVAKKSGATGGTLIHARGLASEEAAKFLGITIQSEKDIVLILTPHENRQKIMESITHEIGLSTPGKGICFSLPVNATLGLGAHI